MYSTNAREPRLRWWLLTATLAWAVSSCPVKAQDGDALQQWFMREAPQGWAKYQAFWQTLQGVSVGERRDDGKRTFRSRYSFRQCNGNRLDQIEDFKTGSYEAGVGANNSNYSFRLRRIAPDKPWLIQDLSKKVSPDTAELWGVPVIGLSCANNVYLPVLIRSPKFTVVSVARQPDDGRELVRVTFTNSDEKFPVRRGWFLLDPKHDWVVRKGESELRTSLPTRSTFEYNYKEGSDHHPIITRSSYRSITKDGQRVAYSYEITTDYDLYEQKSVPESEFTLSAFGLPEPTWAQARRPLYLWVGVLGAGCLGLALLLWRRHKGRAGLRAPVAP